MVKKPLGHVPFVIPGPRKRSPEPITATWFKKAL